MTNPQTDALAPCPFCGGKPRIAQHGTIRHSHIIYCTDCGADFETGETWNAGNSWNTRPAEAALVTECKELKDEVVRTNHAYLASLQKGCELSTECDALKARIAELDKENTSVRDYAAELEVENAMLKGKTAGLESAQDFTHKQCPNGCGYCQCKGPCERYGTGSLPPTPVKE